MTKEKPISMQQIFRWLVEAIKYAYMTHDLEPPLGIKSHQTREQVVSITEMAGIDPQLICQTATWASSNNFAKYYRHVLIARARLVFGRRVLKLAGPSSRVTGTGSLLGYQITQQNS